MNSAGGRKMGIVGRQASAAAQPILESCQSNWPFQYRKKTASSFNGMFPAHKNVLFCFQPQGFVP